MRFTFANNIMGPDAKYDIKDWNFCCDLREVFNMDSNNDISSLLEKRGVIVDGDVLDSESSCTWVYFESEPAARAFLTRLNKQPEVKAYQKPTKEVCYVVSRKDWRKMTNFLKQNMSEKKRNEMTNLGIRILEIQEHWIAAK
jgi:hypothetical protein